jgi:hypothetical protein
VAADRKNGTAALLECCQPDLSQPCAKCSAVSWELLSKVSCLVFLRGAAVRTEFATFSCSAPGCDGVLEAGGIEFGLLRKTQQLAFGHDLLYPWADAVSSHRSVPFHGFWLETLKAYKK